VYVFGMYCKKRERGTGSEIIIAAKKNATYVRVFLIVNLIDEKVAS
jgi:hypothetical protein